jgi:hypothetical protein
MGLHLMDRPLDYAEPAAHVVLIGVAVALSWMYWYSGGLRTSNTSRTVHVDSSKVLRTWQPADRRIFLFVSPTCPYCNRSMDFYARLGRVVDSMRGSGAPLALAAVIDGADPPRAQRQVLHESGVHVDTLLILKSISLDPVGVPGVPTVAIEQPSSNQIATWVGLQDSTGEQEILSAMQQLGGR